MRLLNLFSTSSFRNDGAMRGGMLPHLLLVLSSTERSHERASIIPSHTADTSSELLSTPSQPRHIQRLFVLEILGTNVKQEIVSGFRLTVQDTEGESF